MHLTHNIISTFPFISFTIQSVAQSTWSTISAYIPHCTLSDSVIVICRLDEHC